LKGGIKMSSWSCDQKVCASCDIGVEEGKLILWLIFLMLWMFKDYVWEMFLGA